MALGRNDLCPCGSGKKLKKCCTIFKGIGINVLGEDSYLIRLTDDKTSYVHYVGKEGEYMTHIIKEGLKGACLWHKKEGLKFIEESKANNLELVPAREVLGNDGSLN